MSGRQYVGVDLGGTQLRMAAIHGNGSLAGELFSVPTGRDFGPDELARQLSSLAQRVSSDSGRLEALGVGTAGVIRAGRLTQVDNLPRLTGVEIAALVEAAAGCPVRIENDARCFVLAEGRFGAGRGARSLCGVPLGTGVGCGVVIEGEVHRGATSEAGEVWRIPLRGAPLEDSLSGAGVVRSYRASGGQDGPGVDAQAIAERARQGDAHAQKAWRALGEDLSFLCHCIFSVVDPERVVLGGSLARSRDLFEKELSSRLDERMARVKWAELGPAAGVIGAAALNIP